MRQASDYIIHFRFIKMLANTAEIVGLDCATGFFRGFPHKNSLDLLFVCTLNTRYILTCIWKLHFLADLFHVGLS